MECGWKIFLSPLVIMRSFHLCFHLCFHSCEFSIPTKFISIENTSDIIIIPLSSVVFTVSSTSYLFQTKNSSVPTKHCSFVPLHIIHYSVYKPPQKKTHPLSVLKNMYLSYSDEKLNPNNNANT
jgi:hypothetical protein